MTTQTNTRTDNQSVAPKALTPEDRSALKAVTIFPVLIIAAALWGFVSPATAGMLTPHVAILLGVIMFGMGLTPQSAYSTSLTGSLASKELHYRKKPHPMRKNNCIRCVLLFPDGLRGDAP
ncbi:sodium/bile acid transporter [Mobiluncus mulieris]|uniref:sodium/bile acid transporter n=1 Tax=Mobiluncus mulieris TaxID=2052 RepID=UPI0021E240C3|nr:sodium/bile acid transporter [Mobiluncus mulieris]MCV0003413.1 sodium/bile acid transporter [Mobiluncus mulieris]